MSIFENLISGYDSWSTTGRFCLLQLLCSFFEICWWLHYSLYINVIITNFITFTLIWRQNQAAYPHLH